MEMHLAGQKVVVFGAAQGIGRAIAQAFAAEGCHVVGVDVRPPALPRAELPTDSPAPPWLVADVTRLEEIEQLAGSLSEVEHIVYSVGVGSGQTGFPFWNVAPSVWGRTLEVNLVGAANVAHAFGRALAERRRGTFLFLTSVAGQIGSPTDPPYSAAKAGLINFMQVVAKDLAPFGVRANALSPGMVKTELNQSVWQAVQAQLPDAARQTYEAWADDKLKKVAPLARWQTPEECAAVAVFLASPHARNITGQTINVDGGQVMHA
jgi:NAD(P)-dependent dehydrogenase (short-subunit alcohol dehydrogenase family)